MPVRRPINPCMNIIETRKLSRWYGMADGVHGLTLDVPTGSVCVLLGVSGAGKTTATRVLMNLLRPSQGEARVLGVDSRKLGPREFSQIGYLGENHEAPMDLTVREWLNYCRPFYPTWDPVLERTLLKQFALPLDRKLRLISRGMRVKAALLTVLAYRPKLLVLDELFSGLETPVQEDCLRGLRLLMADMTVLAAVGELGEFERVATHVALLDEGRLRLHETAVELRARFRQVSIEGVGAKAEPLNDWLAWERTGTTVRFVEPNYRSEGAERGWQERLSGGTTTVEPMTLRQIFLSMTLSGRVVRKAMAA